MFSDELEHYVNNITTAQYGEVVEFAKDLDKRVSSELIRLEKEIKKIKDNSRAFAKLFIRPIKLAPEIEIPKIDKTFNGITISCIVIKTHDEALKYPYKPCAIIGVKDWVFFSFPELGHILPVQHIPEFLGRKPEVKNTKIHYGLFNKVPLDIIVKSDFAIYPYNKTTWDIFNKMDKSMWDKYLKQLIIRQLSTSSNTSQFIPLTGTECLTEIGGETQPEHMATTWALFVQLYFILYLFRKTADKTHFSI